MEQLPIQFQTPAEFEARPGYHAELHCTSEELKGIVGKYSFGEPLALRCGLNGCNTKHWNGYLIATHDGRETHCGRDCGKREFGVKFEDVEASFRRAEDEAARRSNIQAALIQRDELLTEARRLEEAATLAVGAVRDVIQLMSRESPLLGEFNSAVRNGGLIRRAIKVDKDVLEAMGQRPRGENLETIGVIQGLRAVKEHSSIVGTIRGLATWPLRALTPESLDGLKARQIEAKSADISKARDALQAGRDFVAAAEQFTSAENRRTLAKLALVVAPKYRNQRLSKIVLRLESNT